MNRLDKTEPRPLRIDLSRTFIRRTDLSDANLEGANLSYADCQNAIFRRISKDAVRKDLDDWVKKQ
jgi:uncharacterized protein YjbI with pentapeptide repeats